MQEPVHRTTIEPHEGQQWSMMNARHFLQPHVNSVLIGTNVFGPSVPSPASGKSVSRQKNEFGKPEGSHFSTSPLSCCCCFIFFSSAACFAAGHGTTYREYIQSFDFFGCFTLILAISGEPLSALRSTLGEPSNGMKSGTLGTKELRMLTSRRYRVGNGPEFVVVRIGQHWPLTLQNFPLIIGCKNFCTGNLWGEGFFGGSNIVPTAN